MKWLALVTALLAPVAPAWGADNLPLMGVGKGPGGGAAYAGPGDVVSGATTFWGLRAYNAAYASGLNKLARICTPSDATCADVNSDSTGNFNLAGTPSLTCNNVGSICTVRTLYDQIGTNCSGPCDVTQATEADRPKLVVPGVANGCSTTSQYCISSTRSSTPSLVAVAGLASSVPQAFTISVVFNNPVRQGDEYLLYSNFTVPSVISGFGGANGFACGAGSNATATVSDGAFHAVQCVFNSTSSDVNVDGSVNTGDTGTNGTFTSTFVLLNSAGGASNSFEGVTNEWGLWPTGFTPTQSSNMSSNQHTYWGF